MKKTTLILIILTLLILILGVIFSINVLTPKNYICTTIDNEEIKCIRTFCHDGYITGEDENGTVYILKNIKK